MVTEINNKEILTLQELKAKYATKWFQYIIVGDMNFANPMSNTCYVVHTADTEYELYRTPCPEFEKHNGGIASGNSVVYPMEVGGVYVHD